MTEPKKIRVLIADDHPALRIGIRLVLEQSPDILVVAEAADGQQALEKVAEHSPDVLLLDLQMPIMDGFDVLAALAPKNGRPIILILSANNDRYLISQTIEMGAWGYYMKEEAPTEIIGAIREAIKGNGKGRRPKNGSGGAL